MTAPERPTPRRRRAIVAAAACAAVAAGVVVAVVVAPSTDSGPAPPAAPPPVDLRVSLLDRPPTGADRLASVPAGIAAGSVRFGAGDDRVEWFVGRRAGRPGSVCLIRVEDDRVAVAACGAEARLADTGIVASAWRPPGADGRRSGRPVLLAAVVPDGITRVSVGRRTSTPRDNVVTVPLAGGRHDAVVLQGPSAAAIRPAAGVAVLVSGTATEPVVAVSGAPPRRRARAPAGAPPVPSHPLVSGTLADAVDASPFTVYAPVTPPLPGAQRVEWTRHAPHLFPQVVMSWLPERSGQGVSIIEGPHRGLPGARPSERVVRRRGRVLYVRDAPALAPEVRLVIGGTDVAVSGGLPLDGLLDVAASLRPAG